MPEGQLEEGHLLGGRYRIIRVIGQGGMGTVYQAEHERLNAILAVKEIRAQAATGTAQQTTIEQYEQEARFLVRLSHPNLPKVTDAFIDNGRFYLVMDFVEGVTLEAALRERGGKPLEPELVVDWAIEIADVLSYLHEQNPPIIFRDLKPSNVMVQPDGHIMLIDFGIARRFQPGASQDTALLGSVGYSPPEQFGRNQTDTRSDIYALGATMHHLLTARDPSQTPFKFAPVDQVNLGAPAALSRLTAQCLTMEQENRPQDAAAVSAELRSIRDDMHRSSGSRHTGPGAASSGDVSGPGTLPRLSLPAGNPSFARRRAYVIAAVLAAAILGGGVYMALTPYLKSRGSGRPALGVSKADPLPPANSSTGVTQAGADSGPTSGGESPSSGGTLPSDQTQTSVDHGTAPVTVQGAQCSAEVVGQSPDGKSLRIHITGTVNGKDGAAGMVAAYFYNSDKTPLPAKDPKGANATPSGQLFGEFTFQIDADSKPIDGVIDVPVDQFVSTSNLLFRCIVYADNQSAGQTDFLPLSADTPASSGA